jgi:hypothetical protein
MITEEAFYKVQSILDGRNRSINAPILKRNKDNPEFPLRRIVKCAVCGTSITGGWSKGKLGRYGYYFCRNRCKIPRSSVAVGTIETATIKLLEDLAPSDNTISLFNALMRDTYRQRVASLKRRREQADAELQKLYEFRQVLLEKNMSGVYSDEIFKEQNRMVEEKIKDIQVAKNDELITKYNIEAMTKFVKNKLQHPVKTYTQDSKNPELEPDIEQKRVLLCSIFPSGLVWSANGYSNTVISTYYKAIRDFSFASNSFGRAARSRLI